MHQSVDTQRRAGAGRWLLTLILTSLFWFGITPAPAAYAATFTVTTTADSGPGSLRQALLDANATPGADTISFNIPGAGPHTIAPSSALPHITDPVTMDGLTQPGASCARWPPTLQIELNGSGAGSDISGLVTFADNSTVRGLVINRFGVNGVSLDSANNRLECNFIGVDVAGTTALGNGDNGILVWGGNNTIGGATAGTRNLISGNGADGIQLTGAGASDNRMMGNYIGTDVTGTADLGNGRVGILIGGGSANIIGGANAGEGNLISGNGVDGVRIEGAGNQVVGNKIGVDESGTAPLGNTGVGVFVGGTGNNNLVGGTAAGAGNVIAHNGIGVVVFAAGQTLQRNAIFANTGLGVDLGSDGVTANDPGDGDTGPNNLQNFPVLASVTSSGAASGSLNSTPNRTFRLEFFANTDCDPSGHGAGETFLGSQEVTTNGSGNVNFTFNFTPVAGKPFLTATATDSTTGDTSEFSACRAANSAPVAVGDHYTTDEDTALTVAAPGVLGNDSDVDGDPLTVVPGGGPSHGTLTLNADGSFSYTPNSDFHGVDSFVYTVIDDEGNIAIANVIITVIPVNDAPVAIDDSYSTNEDTPLAAPAPGVLGNDSDVDGDSLRALLVSSPAHGTLTLNPDASFTYTPDTNFNGADSFTYKANDGQVDSNVATVSILVVPVNDPPVAVDDHYTTNQNTPLTVAAPGVLGNDSDVDGDSLRALLVSGPAHGTLTLNVDGSFSYTPNSDFHGVDSFVYTVVDGKGGSATATVTITVVSALDLIDRLIAGVQELVTSGTLNRPQGNGLLSKLEQTKDLLVKGKTAQAITLLRDDFIVQVNNLLSEGVLTAAQAQSLIGQANAVIISLGGSVNSAANASDQPNRLFLPLVNR